MSGYRSGKTYYSPEIAPPRSVAHTGIYVACCIAAHFKAEQPTVAALCERFGMSRATAYRWVGAWKLATGHT